MLFASFCVYAIIFIVYHILLISSYAIHIFNFFFLSKNIFYYSILIVKIFFIAKVNYAGRLKQKFGSGLLITIENIKINLHSYLSVLLRVPSCNV